MDQKQTRREEEDRYKKFGSLIESKTTEILVRELKPGGLLYTSIKPR